MRLIKGACDRFRAARQRQYYRLSLRLEAYFEKHPVEMPPQRLPDGGLFIQYDGEPGPRVYGSTATTHPTHE